MKAIQSIKWKRNAPNASILNVQIIYDDLKTICSIYWSLLADDKVQVDTGNTNIQGDAYQGWDGNNDFPYEYVANELGVTIISDYYGSTLGAENI